MRSSFNDAYLLNLWERAATLPPVRRSICLLAGLSDTAESAADFPIGERDRRLMLVRKELFGNRIEAVAECPRCMARVELEFLLSELASDCPFQTELSPVTMNGFEVVWRLPTSNDLADLADETDSSRIRNGLIQRCLLEVRKETRPVAAQDCPQELIQEISRAMSQADPLGVVQLDLECPNCGTIWSSVFDIGVYLWKEIDIWAKRRLREVHQLASFYSWSEADILGMSFERRRMYLELVES